MTGQNHLSTDAQADDGLIIEGPVHSEVLAKWDMVSDLNIFREPKKQHKALVGIAASEDGMVYIARIKDTIVGYVTFHDPDQYSRWSKHPGIMELGAIEVSPSYRNLKIGSKLMQKAFTNSTMEEKIVITIEFCWHWDLDNTCLDIWKYQKMLGKLFGCAGLERVSTDDPEILEHVANVMMARIGNNVSQEDIDLFEQMKFCSEESIFNY